LWLWSQWKGCLLVELCVVGQTTRSFTWAAVTWEERADIYFQLLDLPTVDKRCQASVNEVDRRDEGAGLVEAEEVKWSIYFQLGFEEDYWAGLFLLGFFS
jgi:hypothetical protein